MSGKFCAQVQTKLSLSFEFSLPCCFFDVFEQDITKRHLGADTCKLGTDTTELNIVPK